MLTVFYLLQLKLYIELFSHQKTPRIYLGGRKIDVYYHISPKKGKYRSSQHVFTSHNINILVHVCRTADAVLNLFFSYYKQPRIYKKKK